MTTLQNAPGFYNPKIQTVQGANSKTFRRVELDTTLTGPELFEFHAKNSPEHPVFVYDDDGQERVIRFPEVWRAIRKGATIVSRDYQRQADYYAKAQEGKSENDPPIMGILATAGGRPLLSCIAPTRSSRPCHRFHLVLHAQDGDYVPRPDRFPHFDAQLCDRGGASGV